LQGSGFLPPFDPAQIAKAYGYNLIRFESASGGQVSGNGSGQTIAIIDAYNDPNIATDLAAFDTMFNLSAPASFKVVSQTGSTQNLPTNSVSWGVEESLDVEWSHALAPKAHIILVEANSSSFADLDKATEWAASQNAVSVVSMSFGGGEAKSELSQDSVYTTPASHTGGGVTFVASTGDDGAPGGYPAYSPNVVAAGGTSLYLNPLTSNYGHESAWSDGGGGKSKFEPEPAYQENVQTSGKREIPDISFDANPSTGVIVLDSFGDLSPNNLLQVGGTSVSAPSLAALFAIVNQGRKDSGEPTLTNAPGDLYSLPQSDFHDITAGSNGNPAGPGYDMATGLGTPRANLVVTGLIALTEAVRTSGSAVVLPAGLGIVGHSSRVTFATTVPLSGGAAGTVNAAPANQVTSLQNSGSAAAAQAPTAVQAQLKLQTDSGTAATSDTSVPAQSITPSDETPADNDLQTIFQDSASISTANKAIVVAALDQVFAQPTGHAPRAESVALTDTKDDCTGATGSPWLLAGVLALWGLTLDTDERRAQQAKI
jgi:subtilase family serine protease